MTYNCTIFDLKTIFSAKGIASANDGYVYFSSEYRGLWKMKKNDPRSGPVCVLSEKDIPNILLQGIACHHDIIYICSRIEPKILTYNIKTKKASVLVGGSKSGRTNGPFDQALLNVPTKITADQYGNLVFVDGDVVRMINMERQTVETFRHTFDPSISGVVCMDDTIYVSCRNQHCIYKIRNNMVTAIAGTPGRRAVQNGKALRTAAFGAPDGLCIDGDGNLLVIDDQMNSIRRFDLRDDRVHSILIPHSIFTSERWFCCIASDKEGNIYIGAPAIDAGYLLMLEPSWQKERLLWIAFLKEDATYCDLAKLPKDLIKEVIGLLFRAKFRYKES